MALHGCRGHALGCLCVCVCDLVVSLTNDQCHLSRGSGF